MCLIDNFNDYLIYHNAGIQYLPEDKLKKLILSLNNDIDIDTNILENAKKLMNNMLIQWYNINKAIFNYPINGHEFIDINDKNVTNIISKLYKVSYNS